MKMLFFYESANLGGQQTHTFNLVKGVAARGHDVVWAYLYGSAMRPAFETCATVEHIPINLRPKGYLYQPWKVLAIARQLAKICQSHEVTVVISGSGIGSLMCGIAARLLKIRHYRIVGCSLVQIEKRLYRLYRWIGIDRLIDGYFGWPAQFEELERKRVPRSKFIEIGNSVDTQMFCPLDPQSRANTRASLAIGPDDFVIGWVGRPTKYQVRNTVALGRTLKEKGFTRFKLLFVSGGPELPVLKQAVREAQLDAFAVFTGWVPMEEVNTYLNAMDVVPLLEADPHGGSLLREAMAAGRIALSVDGQSGSQRRFMPNGSAILVAHDDFVEHAADALLAIATDSKRREQIERSAREYALAHMSFDVQVETILDAVQADLGKQARVRRSMAYGNDTDSAA